MLDVPGVIVGAKFILGLIPASAADIIWDLNHAAVRAEDLCGRQLGPERLRRYPCPGANGYPDAVCCFFIPILGRPAVCILRVQQQRLIIHISAEPPKMPDLCRGKVRITQAQMDVVSMVSVPAFNQIGIVKYCSMLPEFQPSKE